MSARRIRVLIGLMALVLVAAFPVPVAAIDPIVGIPLPEEPDPVPLTDLATEARSFDLDRDGVNELVAVVAREDAGGLAAIQVWSVEADGTVEPTNSLRIRRAASVDELLSGRGRLGIDRDDMIPMRMSEPAKFLVVQRGGRDVLLVAAMGTQTEFDVPCCLTIWEIVVDDAGVLDLRLVADTQRFALQVAAVDFENDGTDELLVTEGNVTGTEGAPDASLLRWSGDQYERTGFEMGFADCCPTVADVADTDSLPGEEVLLVDFSGAAPQLYRLTMPRSMVSLEGAEIDEVGDARALALATGSAIVTANFTSQALTIWSWPAGGRPMQIARRVTGGQIAAVLGSGEETRIVISADPSSGSIFVVPGDLGGGAGPTATVSRDRRASIFASSLPIPSDFILPTPFFGVLPDGLPGARDVFVFGGTQITPVPDPNELVADAPMALLPDMVPVARVGPDGGWTAIRSGTPDMAFGFGRPVAAEDMLSPTPVGALHLTSTATLAEVESDLGRLSPTFTGVAPDLEHPPILIVGNEAVDVELEAPPGSVVNWVIRSVQDSITVTPDGVARIRLMEPAGPSAPDGSGANVGIRVVTPGGHAYSGSWRINVYRQPPDLGIRDEPGLIDFSPTLSGQTLPGSQLTINGVVVPIAADGSFTVPVEASIVPTELHVVVVDAVGNRTERVVTRVWPLDYRQLPFVPIAVLLTLAAGLLLFLRKPDSRPGRDRPDDGATFEEIGG